MCIYVCINVYSYKYINIDSSSFKNLEKTESYKNRRKLSDNRTCNHVVTFPSNFLYVYFCNNLQVS